MASKFINVSQLVEVPLMNPGFVRMFVWIFGSVQTTGSSPCLFFVFVFLSVMFGYATTIIPRIYTYYVSTALFAIFGVRMLREGLKMSPDEGQEELEEVQAEIKKKDEEVCKPHAAHTYICMLGIFILPCCNSWSRVSLFGLYSYFL